MADLSDSESRSLVDSDGYAIGSPLESTGRFKLVNIIMLGVSFMFLFTAFQTCAMMETLVLEGAKNETSNPGTGYTSLSIIYGSLAVSNWIAPPVVAWIGAKWSMLAGGACYCIFIGLFLKPMAVTLYITSALVGFGAAILWTGQGSFLLANSDLETTTRNTGIFWALFQCSLLWGNLFVYFKFNHVSTIDKSERTTLFIILTVISVIGLLLIFSFRNKQRSNAGERRFQWQSQYMKPLVIKLTQLGMVVLFVTNLIYTYLLNLQERSPLQAVVRSFQLFISKEMILLSVCFIYTGFEQSFWSSVFITSIGHTSSLGLNAKQLSGLAGVFIGAGEITGGIAFGLLGNWSSLRRPGRDSVVLFGFTVHVVCFFLVFIGLPFDSPLVQTYAAAFIVPNPFLIMFCAFLLGLGDSSYNTQSLGSALAFVYSQYLGLQWQLLILTIFAGIGSLFFFIVDRWANIQTLRQYTDIQTRS